MSPLWGTVPLLMLLAACAPEKPPPVVTAPVVPVQDSCGPSVPHDHAVTSLSDRWGETQIAVALDADGNVIEFFAHPDGTTWTILRTSPTGMACVLTAGEGWELASPTGSGT